MNVRRLGARLLAGWMSIVARFGEVQTLVLLGLVYAFVFGPIGIGASLARRDFLNKSGLGEPGTAFRAAETNEPDLESVKRPF